MHCHYLKHRCNSLKVHIHKLPSKVIRSLKLSKLYKKDLAKANFWEKVFPNGLAGHNLQKNVNNTTLDQTGVTATGQFVQTNCSYGAAKLMHNLIPPG